MPIDAQPSGPSFTLAPSRKRARRRVARDRGPHSQVAAVVAEVRRARRRRDVIDLAQVVTDGARGGEAEATKVWQLVAGLTPYHDQRTAQWRKLRYSRTWYPLIQDAQTTLERGTGDCKSFTVLCAALLGSIGHRVAIVHARRGAHWHCWMRGEAPDGAVYACDACYPERGLGFEVPRSKVDQQWVTVLDRRPQQTAAPLSTGTTAPRPPTQAEWDAKEWREVSRVHATWPKGQDVTWGGGVLSVRPLDPNLYLARTAEDCRAIWPDHSHMQATCRAFVQTPGLWAVLAPKVHQDGQSWQFFYPGDTERTRQLWTLEGTSPSAAPDDVTVDIPAYDPWVRDEVGGGQPLMVTKGACIQQFHAGKGVSKYWWTPGAPPVKDRPNWQWPVRRADLAARAQGSGRSVTAGPPAETGTCAQESVGAVPGPSFTDWVGELFGAFGAVVPVPGAAAAGKALGNTIAGFARQAESARQAPPVLPGQLVVSPEQATAVRARVLAITPNDPNPPAEAVDVAQSQHWVAAEQNKAKRTRSVAIGAAATAAALGAVALIGRR